MEVFVYGALDREGSRTCIHSVTTGDVLFDQCVLCVTDRDEAFRVAIFEKRHELYQAVIDDESLSVSGDNDNDISPKLYPNLLRRK